MTRHRTYLLSAGIAIAAISLTLAACGSSSSGAADSSTSTPAAATTATTAATTTAPAAVTKAKTVAVVLGKPNEFSLIPAPTSVPAGKVTFVVTNRGSMVHEMVVVPAPNGAAALKQPDGSASEAGSKGEVADLAAGATGRLTVTLPAGKYALLCNLPGHFAGGMYADFTVS
jgi:uncharacterized cupredoxin-like copper-binding protein